VSKYDSANKALLQILSLVPSPVATLFCHSGLWSVNSHTWRPEATVYATSQQSKCPYLGLYISVTSVCGTFHLIISLGLEKLVAQNPRTSVLCLWASKGSKLLCQFSRMTNFIWNCVNISIEIRICSLKMSIHVN